MEAQKAFQSTTGLGKVISEGTEQEKAERKWVNQAITAGFVNPNDSAEDQEAGLQLYATQQEEANIIDRKTKRLAALQAEATYKGTLDKNAQTRIDNERKNLEYEVREGAYRLLNGGMKRHSNRLVALAKDPQFADDKAGLISAMEAEAVALKEEVKDQGANLGGDFITQADTRIDDLTKIFTDQASRIHSAAVAENALREFEASETMKLIANEDVRPLWNISQLRLGDALSATPAGVAYLSKTIAGLQTGGPAPDLTNPNPADKEGAQVTLKMLEHNVDLLNSGSVDNPEHTEHTLTAVDQVLRAIPAGDMFYDHPGQFNDIVDFLAKPATGNLFIGNEGRMEANAVRASHILHKEYSLNLVPAIQNEVPEPTLAAPTWGTTGMVFKGPAFHIVADLNRGLGPAINRYVRAQSHLEGHKDYQKFWEQTAFPMFFPEYHQIVTRSNAAKADVDPALGE
jgi:hypothetical protein